MHGARLTSLLLALLLLVELMRISAGLLASPLNDSALETPRAIASNRAAGAAQSIVAAHLFGRASSASAPDPADAPISAANLLLAATFATQAPRDGIAIIAAQGSSRIYRVGEEVADARLRGVYFDHVLLERGGRLEKLVLRGAASAGAAVAANTAPIQAPAADTRPGLQNPDSLASVMRAEASLDNASAKLRGFRIYSGSNRAGFTKSGLRGGDLVVAVNGTPVALRDRETGQQVLDSIQSAGAATLTIVRNGQTRDIFVDSRP